VFICVLLLKEVKMRSRILIVLLSVFLLALISVAMTQASGPVNFRAHLDVAQEVPEPDVEGNPRGQAIFQLSRDGSELHYKLIVANIENVIMAHIHLGPVGETGPVVVWLYPDGPPPQEIPGRFDGVLAEGTITSENLVGPLAGATLADLIDEIQAGNAYVNVHTVQNPPGEIRGQID
jgi:hypothetical protein